MGITPRTSLKPWPMWVRWSLFIGVIAAGLIFLVTAPPYVPPPPEPIKETPLSRCIDAGGIPTTSVWDGRLTGCIFPPAKAGQ